jgi:hypothetical protein
VPSVLKIWEPKAPGNLWDTPGLLRDCFNFYLICAILNCHKCHKISVSIPHPFIILFVFNIRNIFLYTTLCEKNNILCNESIVNLVFLSSYFLQSIRVDGTSKLGSGEDKRCSGLKVLKTKVKRGTAN